ncbi:MAG TPA: hypothetical protein VNU94_03230 [Acidobacteriaceae bacterium]|jgi:hypothetical protein|nr:hypothetical protein [Acidobacteriaceae bacterium]
MQVLMYAAFSLISVPAYVAMFSSKDKLTAKEVEESEEETCALFEKHLEEMTASAPQRMEPTSGLFPTIHPRRFV